MACLEPHGFYTANRIQVAEPQPSPSHRQPLWAGGGTPSLGHHFGHIPVHVQKSACSAQGPRRQQRAYRPHALTTLA